MLSLPLPISKRHLFLYFGYARENPPKRAYYPRADFIKEVIGRAGEKIKTSTNFY